MFCPLDQEIIMKIWWAVEFRIVFNLMLDEYENWKKVKISIIFNFILFISNINFYANVCSSILN